VILRIPSTTNSLEATHGHLNETITRRNSFWQSLTILFDSIADKTLHFDLALAHDFRASMKRSKRRAQLISGERMAEECAFFGTSSEACGCAETVHLASLYQTDVPCNHRYSLGAKKPGIPRGMSLPVQPSTGTMIHSETEHDRNVDVVIAAESLKKYAIRQIQRFSHSADKSSIAAYVDQYFDTTGPSALDIPLAVHVMFSLFVFEMIGNLGKTLRKIGQFRPLNSKF
jgi:hypothetical protein